MFPFMHAELMIGDSMFFLSDEFPGMGCRSPQPAEEMRARANAFFSKTRT